MTTSGSVPVGAAVPVAKPTASSRVSPVMLPPWRVVMRCMTDAMLSVTGRRCVKSRNCHVTPRTCTTMCASINGRLQSASSLTAACAGRPHTLSSSARYELGGGMCSQASSWASRPLLPSSWLACRRPPCALSGRRRNRNFFDAHRTNYASAKKTANMLYSTG
eukprot:scaffold32869_cov49-Phaeocystis_antarctica.AAC.2